MLSVHCMQRNFYVQIVRTIALPTHVYLGVLIRLNAIPQPMGAFLLFSQLRQPGQAAQTIDILDQFGLGHSGTIKHRPPAGFGVSSMKFQHMAEQLLGAPMLGMCCAFPYGRNLIY